MTVVPKLVGERVVLEPLVDADSDQLFAWINDEDLVASSAAFSPTPRPEHDAWFDSVRKHPSTRIFAIRTKENGRLIGSCQLHSIHDANRSAELQIRIGARDEQGRGNGADAVRLLLSFGFGELRLHRIQLHVFATNEPALRLYRRLGFQTEGVLKEAVLIEGARVDVLVMAMLRVEWEAR